MKEKTLDERAVEVRREYYRRWRAANRDKIRATNERYWKKKALQLESTIREDDSHVCK